MQIIINFYNTTFRQHRNVIMSDDHLHILWASTVSIFVCAGMVGAFSCGVVADIFGRYDFHNFSKSLSKLFKFRNHFHEIKKNKTWTTCFHKTIEIHSTAAVVVKN